ncbi:MAG: hypothetical protein KDJ75_09340 [Alphaproteobacteria bacterium]|nr:hypothetical protein [Alphaproteobacteria bacterium]
MKYLPAWFCAVFLLVNPFPAAANEADGLQAQSLQVSRRGDVDMSCGALSQEAATMRDIILTTQGIKDDSRLKQHGVNAAGAIGGFLIGSVTGGVGLAAAGFLIDHNIGETASDADSVQDIAAQRRALMIGIHTAKGCYGPMEHALQDGTGSGRGDSTVQSAGTAVDSGERLAAIHPAGGDEPSKPRYNQ